ncbi:hypothetical protein HID58_094040 [Brassica napus]|uniref:non-specific serine/threonine protein kinase n=1 Tax=Brassica napus TaxID=3708 RepID=A0ABQ7X930_BRANA|nr:hypothetical protein HID58_094040 [Brassica napus]
MEAMLSKRGKKLDSSESSHHVSSLGPKESANLTDYPPLNIIHPTPQPRREMQKPLFDHKKMENLIQTEPTGSNSHYCPLPSKKVSSSTTTQRDAEAIVHQSPQPRKEMQKPLFDPKKMENLIKPEPTGFSNHHRPSQLVNTSNSNTKPNNNSNSSSNMSSRNNSIESTSSNPSKPHTGGDIRWDAVNMLTSKGVQLGISDFRLLKRLGYGDIGSVYLVELRGTNTFFAMKVMDKASLVSRNKLLRAQTEREILSQLDHPFLPTLYSHFETDKVYCLVMEFCGEYLHMLGIVYRDLKPENVLVRDDGHIMLSDFDLSLRCSVNPTLVNSSSGGGSASTFFPRILQSTRKNRKAKSDFGLFVNGSMPELMAEPTNVKSMSFVGTHEYLAPEIIRGEGHGSAVDWWTLGIFIYELLYGSTPFKGQENRATLHNVIKQALRFPDLPHVSSAARDLIKGLLVKEPQKRIAYKRGATEIKQHPFFEGVNWALIRSATPPHIPEPVDFTAFASKGDGGKKSNTNRNDPDYNDFEYF